MAMFILLTPEQAASVRGPSNSNASASLYPVERQGDVWILGAEVLDDPAHAAHRFFLSTFPQMDNAHPDFPPAVE